MGIREVMKGRKAGEIIDREVAGIGTVKFKRLSTKEALAITGRHPDAGMLAMLAEGVMDEHGAKVFNSVADVQAADWGVVSSLIAEMRAVTGLTAGSIEKPDVDEVAAEKK